MTCKSRRSRVFIGVVILVTFYYTFAYFGYYGKRHCLTFWNEEVTPHMFSPWRLTCNQAEEKSRLESFLLRYRNESRVMYHTKKDVNNVPILSTSLTEKIDAIQRMGCDQPNFMCGHKDRCGLACQIHHRIGCLLISYVTNMPLIHTVDRDEWSYSNKWSDAFLPMGSNCTPGKNTYTWDWLPDPNSASKCHNVLLDNFGTEIPYPLSWGIPVTQEFHNSINSLKPKIPDPFVWMIGQFAKYAMRLNQTMEQKIQLWKKEVGFNPENATIIGMQIRRTDKTDEGLDTFHELDEYFIEAEAYFKKIELSQSSGRESLPRIVYLSSDNTTVLEDAKTRYPSWKIIGFHSTLSESLTSRKHGLFEIVRDIVLLSECDYIICGLSSNVCRLLYEIQTYKDFMYDSPHLKSLDGDYDYALKGLHTMSRENMKIWTISDKFAQNCV